MPDDERNRTSDHDPEPAKPPADPGAVHGDAKAAQRETPPGDGPDHETEEAAAYRENDA